MKERRDNMHWSSMSTLVEEHFQPVEKHSIVILSPFITTEYLVELFSASRELHIVTSWRKDHLASGVSNLDLYEVVRLKKGWTLYINDRLHAKVYCRNFERMLVGSANLTRKGLGDGEDSNIETLVELPCDPESEREIREVLRTSLVMDDETFEIYRQWYDTLDLDSQFVDTGSVVLPNPDRTTFLVSQLPASTSPHRLWSVLREDAEVDNSWNEFSAAEHDMNNLGMLVRHFSTYEEFNRALTEKMTKQRFFTAFMERIDTDGFRFGYGKEWVHTNCIDDPVPYRKELTRTVQNLFAWVVALFPDEFEIIQPRHTQIIRRIAPQERNELCSQTGRKLNASWYIAANGYPETGIQYKSCPNCSLYAGELIFRLGRIRDGTTQVSSFGFTDKRINGNNPDGIHSWCLECRGTGDPATHTDRAYDVASLNTAQGGLVNITRKGV